MDQAAGESVAEDNSLRLLDHAVEAAISHELGEADFDDTALEKLGIAPQRFRVVAGFKVVSNAARDADVDSDAAARADRLLRYRADKKLVRDKLARVELEPLAVLPLTAWDSICDRAQLFRFAPQGNKVGYDRQSVLAAAEVMMERNIKAQRNVSLNFWLTLCGIALGVFSMGWVLLYHSDLWPTTTGLASLVIPLAIVTAAALVGCLVIISQPSPIAMQGFEAQAIHDVIAARRNVGTLHQLLWPTRRELNNVYTLEISFPDPPEEAQEKLIQLEKTRLPVHIAAHQQAISISGKIDEQDVDFKRADGQLQRDPIVFVVEGSAVAIMAQYGDFAIERDVINEVVNSVHLI